MSKYKKTAVGFERADNKPLEANVFFENIMDARKYATRNKTAYNGQRVYLKKGNGTYGEYQVLDGQLINMEGVSIIYADGLYGLTEKSNLAEFGQCFGARTGEELYKILQDARHVCDNVIDGASIFWNTSSCVATYDENPTYGLSIVISYFYPERVTREYIAAFDMYEADGLTVGGIFINVYR